MGDGLTACSFWNPSWRVCEWSVAGLVLICNWSPSSQALEGKGSGWFSFRGSFTPWSGSPFLSQVFGITAVCQPRPICMGFWLHCNTAKLIKIKTQHKNSFIPLHVYFMPRSGIKLPWVCNLILAITSSSFCLLSKFTMQFQKIFWDELRGKSLLDCCTLFKQGKDATDEICYQEEFDRYFCTKRKTSYS